MLTINRKLRAPIGLSVLLLCTGCSIGPDVGPIGQSDFLQTVGRQVDLGEEPIRVHGRADWKQGVDKFSFGSAGVGTGAQGILLIQDSRLIFLKWDEHERKYSILLKLAYSEAKDVRRRVWGATQRFVIENKDGTLNAFSYMTDGGCCVSNVRTSRALAILRKTIPSSDAHL